MLWTGGRARSAEHCGSHHRCLRAPGRVRPVIWVRVRRPRGRTCWQVQLSNVCAVQASLLGERPLPTAAWLRFGASDPNVTGTKPGLWRPATPPPPPPPTPGPHTYAHTVPTAPMDSAPPSAAPCCCTRSSSRTHSCAASARTMLAGQPRRRLGARGGALSDRVLAPSVRPLALGETPLAARRPFACGGRRRGSVLTLREGT